MRRHVKILVLVVVVAVAVSAGFYAYHLTLPRVSIMVYPDSRVTGCKEQLNETVILHVKNVGNVDLYINACSVWCYVGGTEELNVEVTYIFENDIVIPVGVEAVIVFPAGGGKVLIKTLSGPPGVVASGGVYAISDSPDPNPFPLVVETGLWIYTREKAIGVRTITFLP